MAPDGDPPGVGAADELAARRKDLEREFDAKVRELKAQQKRAMDHLQQDRLDWERVKKEQAKELADRAERLRRQEQNKEVAVQAQASSSKELEALRERIRSLEGKLLDATAHQRKAEEQAARHRNAARGSAPLLNALGAAAVLAPLVWLTFARAGGDAAAMGWAGAFLGAGVLLNVWRAVAGRTRAP